MRPHSLLFNNIKIIIITNKAHASFRLVMKAFDEQESDLNPDAALILIFW